MTPMTAFATPDQHPGPTTLVRLRSGLRKFQAFNRRWLDWLVQPTAGGGPPIILMVIWAPVWVPCAIMLLPFWGLYRLLFGNGEEQDPFSRSD